VRPGLPARRRTRLLLAATALLGGAAVACGAAVGLAAWPAWGDPARLQALVGEAVERRALVPRLALELLVAARHPDAARRWGQAELAVRPAQGRRRLERAARQGDARAAYALALWLRAGEGTPRDVAAALPWLERAAAGGLGAAHFLLGNAYRDGEGVAPDPRRALAHYEAAAEREDPQALQTLAEAYRSGELGLAPDPERAAALSRDLEDTVHEARPPL
jgi:TPR repeat protein